MGDGPTGETLDLPPAAIAHTSQMMGDDYLYYRVSEGGAAEPFISSMPAWKGVLDEEARWDVINYVRALDGGEDGLRCIRTLFRQAPERLASRGALFAEIGDRQGPATGRLAKEAFRGAKVEIRPDLAGRDRVVCVCA